MNNLLTGLASPDRALLLLCDRLATMLNSALGGVLRVAGVDQALLAGPVPGLLFAPRVGGARSALTSQRLLDVGLLLIAEGGEWHLPLR